ncbi:hypothetical protein GJ744_011096 [Endocarpon pusillum]|uniref:Sugar phosphate phosphatase n=1 Tax=Endocarpon pusillum TaxID=364733 RepID=A0A8H7E354_9EURO|nr:hypothetical protein GJ744_011096 [Endocarpon pusillum]
MANALCMPWFVSDVNARDLEYLIGTFARGTYYPDATTTEREDVRYAGQYWADLRRQGELEFQASSFWTTQHSFGRMPMIDPTLFAELADGDLVVFKGDLKFLNYRKLTYDGKWPKTTPSHEAIGPFAKQHDGRGVRTLVLRTCKADECVGLSAGQEEGLEESNGWTRYGRYGVVSYWYAKG